MPLGLPVKQPHFYGTAQLKSILEASSSIFFKWLATDPIIENPIPSSEIENRITSSDPVKQLSRPLLPPTSQLPSKKKIIKTLHPESIIVADPRKFQDVEDWLEQEFWLFQISRLNRDVASSFKGSWLAKVEKNIYKISSEPVEVPSSKFLKFETNIFQLKRKEHIKKIDNTTFELLERGINIVNRVVRSNLAGNRI